MTIEVSQKQLDDERRLYGRYTGHLPKARNYKEVVKALNTITPFEHSTIKGAWEADAISGEPTYCVWSYRTLVAQYRAKDEWWVTTTKYSVTTSKQCGKIRYAWQMRDEGKAVY